MKSRSWRYMLASTATLLFFSSLARPTQADTATFSFNPSTPHEGDTILAGATAAFPWAYVHLTVSGPIYAEGAYQHIDDNPDGSRTWNFVVAALPAGTYVVEFRAGDPATGRDDRLILVGSTTLTVTPADSDPGHWATFTFDPPTPSAGQSFTAQVTAGRPYGWVHLILTGPVQVEGAYQLVTDNGSGTWTWQFSVGGLPAGSYEVRFQVGDPATGLDDQALMVGTTSLQVLDVEPPPLRTCPYASLQTLAQGAGNAWLRQLTVPAGSSFSVAAFLADLRTRLNCCTTITIVGPDGTAFDVANGGSVQATIPGTYTATSRCGTRTSSITISAVRGKPLPKPEPPTCEDSTVRGALRKDYHVAIDPPRWSCTDVREISEGVKAAAARLRSACSPSSATDADAFKKAMELSSTSAIVKRLPWNKKPCGYSRTGDFCATCGDGNIECTTGAVMSRRTFVHELGHLFNMRNGGNAVGSNSLFDRLQATSTSTLDDADILVFGWNSSGNWCRGVRGWGSPGIPGLAIPCIYQKHPPDDAADLPCLRNTNTNAGFSDYVGETAADMFLNWAYDAFQNKTYSGATTCSAGNDDASNPGDARRTWMTTAMNGICSQYVQ
jgi:hypothetical protein